MADWSRPFETLRKKWIEVPTDLKSRTRATDLLALSDRALLEIWTKTLRSNTTGDGFSIRGWYHALYAEALRDKKVLDVGCGLGFDSVTFAQHRARVTFLDLAEPNIDVVRRICRLLNLTDVDFLIMEDLNSLSALGADYDVIMAIGSLHHAPVQVIRQESHELLSHLKVGGRWLQLSYPKTRWEREGRLPFEDWGKKTDGSETPWAEYYDIEKLFRVVEPHRFDVVLYHEFHNADFNWFDLLYRGKFPEA